jgi:hypothetical protein
MQLDSQDAVHVKYSIKFMTTKHEESSVRGDTCEGIYS